MRRECERGGEKYSIGDEVFFEKSDPGILSLGNDGVIWPDFLALAPNSAGERMKHHSKSGVQNELYAGWFGGELLQRSGDFIEQRE